MPRLATCLPLIGFLAGVSTARAQSASNPSRELYDLNSGLASRSISFENPTGAKGAGGKAASNLGPGRKGAPSRDITPGETVTLCDIQGSGTIRHIWITVPGTPENLRSGVLRAWWDGQAHPSIEAPLGDFMGFAHGKVMPYASHAHSVGPSAGMNIWLPMPFSKIFLDGDTEYPTIVGTGAEDYVGLSWGMQQVTFPFNGASLNQRGFVSMYRWHAPDPVYWQRDCRITIQQIGYRKGDPLFERQDDWSTATFWYEPLPSAPLPPWPDAKARLSDIWREPASESKY
jgi:hypothetical protein